jgi:hypothetical protein
MSDFADVFTLTSAFSLGGVVLLGTVAYVASKSLLPKNTRWQDQYIFVWLVSSVSEYIEYTG